MGERNRWWVVLIALGMVAYGGTVLWSLFFPERRWGPQLEISIVAVLIACVGAYALLMELKYHPEDAPPSFLSQAVQPYGAAWSKLWRTKWLLWVYGAVAVVVAAGNAFGAGVAVIWLGRAQSATSADISQLGFAARVLSNVWMSLPYLSRGVLRKFFPTIGRASWDPIFDVVALLLVLSIVPAISRFRRDPEHARKAGFFALCLALFAVACLVSGAGWIVGVRSYSARLSAPAARTAMPHSGRAGSVKQSDTPFSGVRMGPTPAQMLVSGVAQIASGTIFSAVLIGGILGSLLRNKKGEGVTRSTFVADAVQHFEPLAAIVLICALPGLLSFLMWIPHLQAFGFVCAVLGALLAPLLMFAPFAVVVQRANWWDAILQSVRMWKTAAWRTIPLIAVGAFFFTLANAPGTVLRSSIQKASWLAVGTEPLYTLFTVVSNVLILLAVWEFYTSSVTVPEPVSETA